MKYRTFTSLEELLLKSHIDLALLQTFGTEQMASWLPHGRQKGDLFIFGDFEYVLRTHATNSGLIRRFMEVQTGTYPHEIMLPTEFYAFVNNTTIEKGILELKERVEFKGDLFAPVIEKKYTRWFCDKNYNMPIPISPEAGDNFYPAYGGRGTPLGCYTFHSFKDGTSCWVPQTLWRSVRNHHDSVELAINFSNEIPLLAQDQIRQVVDVPIFLTPNLEEAIAANKEGELRFTIFSPIFTSWFGGAPNVDAVDLSPLHGRTVFFSLENSQGDWSPELCNLAISLIKRIGNSSRIYFLFPDKATVNSCLYPPALDGITHPYFLKRKYSSAWSKKQFFEGVEQAMGIPLDGIPFPTVRTANSEIQRSGAILEPILSTSSCSMVYAPSGIGKTWFSMEVALAVSCGRACFEKWSAPQPRMVFYVDSEMGAEFYNRLSRLGGSDSNLIHIDGQDLDITDAETQAVIEQKIFQNIGRAQGLPTLLILDNLSTLTGFKDSARDWNEVFSWLKKLKSKRVSSLMVHHAGKSGEQRGTSARNVTLDNVFRLTKPNFHVDSDVYFTIEVEKGRNLTKLAKESFSVELNLDCEKPFWNLIKPKLTSRDRLKLVQEYSLKKMPIKNIATELGVTEITIKRDRKKLGITRGYQRKVDD